MARGRQAGPRPPRETGATAGGAGAAPAATLALDPLALKPALAQDPHALTGARDNLLEVAIGREVHAFRTKLGITVSDLAAASGLSNGMLSKIENGVISPALRPPAWWSSRT